MELTYLVPLRRWDAPAEDHLGEYLRWLVGTAGVEVLVVDGSAPELFAAHHRAWGAGVRHVPVDDDLTGRYGKVNGVVTGLRAAGHERVVIADDDVRWDLEGLADMFGLLACADLVCPQNYFDPLPWHARWDSARTLVNRAGGIDFPGTLGVWRRVVLAAGGYDGDVLFENLELIRTVQAVGGRAVSAPDLYVRRLPPSARHFWSQRVRQAYDELATPLRLVAELALAPTAGLSLLRRRGRALVLGAAAAGTAAEVGRRRAGGDAVFPPTCSLLAPVWLAERAVCVWLALALRVVRGGVPYAGTVLATPANPTRRLRRRHRAAARVRPPVVSTPAAPVESPLRAYHPAAGPQGPRDQAREGQDRRPQRGSPAPGRVHPRLHQHPQEAELGLAQGGPGAPLQRDGDHRLHPR